MARREPADIAATDPALPFKRRARRRLVGALVIGVSLAIALPLVLDREPRYPKPDIRVDIPPRDAPLPVRSQNEAGPDSGAARSAGTADSARAARAEAGRAAERAQGGAGGDSSQAASDARQQPREPMLQSLDAPAADGNGGRSTSAAVRTEAEARAQAARQEAVKQEAAKQEAAKQEAARAQAARQEAARQDAARQDAARQDAARQDAAKQELARQEAARQEAARQEAARLAAAKGEPPRPLASQNWAVQIGQFARAENAKAAEARAVALGLRAYSETLQTAQGERFRVRAGPFATRTSAEEARGRLIAAGLEAALIAPEAAR